MAADKQLVAEIANTLRIDGGIYATRMIEEAVAAVPPDQHQRFFNALMGDEHSYLKPLDRVAKVAKRFTGQHDQIDETRRQAKAVYDELYRLHFVLANHFDNMPTEERKGGEDFETVRYQALTIDGEKITPQSLYVLRELGGGEWLKRIKTYQTSKTVIDKIEGVIKDAKRKKLHRGHAIAGEPRNLIGGTNEDQA
jgi:hypothetical protein